MRRELIGFVFGIAVSVVTAATAQHTSGIAGTPTNPDIVDIQGVWSPQSQTSQTEWPITPIAYVLADAHGRGPNGLVEIRVDASGRVECAEHQP